MKKVVKAANIDGYYTFEEETFHTNWKTGYKFTFILLLELGIKMFNSTNSFLPPLSMVHSRIQTEWVHENKIKSEYYRTFSKLNRIIYPGCPQVHHLTVVASNDKKKQNRKALFFFRYLSKGYVKNEDSLFRFRFTIRHSSLIFFSFFFFTSNSTFSITNFSGWIFFFVVYIRWFTAPNSTCVTFLHSSFVRFLSPTSSKIRSCFF